MAKLFTVGHGTRTTEELIAVLQEAGVDVLVDVRRYPGSRRHPHFAREALEHSLPVAGISYDWRGEALGGRRDPVPGSPNIAWRVDAFRGYADHMASAEFRSGLRELEDRATAGVRQAIMCAETVWWRCHRRLIADTLVAHGHEVIHLGMGRDSAHELHQAARRDDRGVLIYDIGVTVPLLDQ
ncbi:MAG: DUF488 domain-containing protein [Actinomycetota bacterium]|nr:DUF488 domain-containing protein [Actinomycetota bacterium]